MDSKKSGNLLKKTAGMAIASASLLIGIPTFAQTQPDTKPAAPTKPAPAAKPASAPAVKPAAATATSSNTIVDVASKGAQFKTLVAAVKAAGLAETLSGKGPFTVFAPTDAAFAKLPKGTLEKLLKPENKATLTKILTYHVVAGAVDSKSIKPGEVKTVEGTPVKVAIKNGRVSVDKARVIKADIKASNGVIHVIDTVIIPADVKL